MERTFREAAESERRTADLVRRHKAGLLNPAEQQEFDRTVYKLTVPVKWSPSSEAESGTDPRPFQAARALAKGPGMTREGHATTAARPAHGRNHADQPRSGMDAGEPSTEVRRPKVEVHRSMAIPTRFKSRGASQESVTGPDSRGDRVARIISDMYTTAAELKTDAGPRMAKLGIKLNLPEPYDGSANIDQFENWLAQLVAWLQMYNLDGRVEQIDLMRVQLLCQTQKGRALTFYQAQLEAAREQGDYLLSGLRPAINHAGIVSKAGLVCGHFWNGRYHRFSRCHGERGFGYRHFRHGHYRHWR